MTGVQTCALPISNKSIKKWLSYAHDKFGAHIFKIDVTEALNVMKNGQKTRKLLFVGLFYSVIYMFL